MKISNKTITTVVLGTVLVVPCIVVGKFIGVAVGAMVGSLGAYSIADKAYDLVTEKFGHKVE